MSFAQLKYSRNGYFTGDGIFYHILAKNILQGRYQFSPQGSPEEVRGYIKYTSNFTLFHTAFKDKPTNYWSPGYPTLLAGIYAIFGIKLWIPALLGCILGVTSCYLIWKIISILHNPIAGLIGAGIYAIHPVAIELSPHLESETISIALMLLIIFCILKWREDNAGCSLTQVIILGVLISALFYIRSTYFLLLIALILALIFTSTPGKWRSIVVLLGIFTISVIPWGLRNQRSLGRFMIFETRGVNVFCGELRLKLRLGGDWSKVPGENEIDKYDYQKADIYSLLRENPFYLARLAGENLKSMFWYCGTNSFHPPGLFLLLLIFALRGIWIIKAKIRQLLPVLLFVVFYLSTVLIFLKGNEARFRLPFEALLIIFIAIAIVDFIARIWTKKIVSS